jgi:hypothetical protein
VEPAQSLPTVMLAWADGGYAGQLVTWATTVLKLTRRSSGGPMTCTPSRSCPAAGSWSGPWPGSPATGAPCGTTNGWSGGLGVQFPQATRPGCRSRSST